MKNEISSEPIKKRWFYGLDSIRFVLAMIVVLSHCPNPIKAQLSSSSSLYLNYLGTLIGMSFPGVAAVIAFFIISGFVIHYPSKQGILNVKSFYTRRLIRVALPLLVIIAVGYFFGSPEKLVVWSLYCELIYYFLYPVLVKIRLSWQNKTRLSFVVAVVTLIIGARIDLWHMVTQTPGNYHGEYWQLGAGFTWLVGLPCWLLGVNLAQDIDNMNKVVSVKSLYMWRLIVFVAAVFCILLRFHFFVSYVFSMTAFSLLAVSWLKNEILYYKLVCQKPVLDELGKISYSIYLCHPIVLLFLYKNIALTPVSYFLYLSVILISSYLLYLILEKPAQRLAVKVSQII